jgi:hypothetical protein
MRHMFPESKFEFSRLKGLGGSRNGGLKSLFMGGIGVVGSVGHRGYGKKAYSAFLCVIVYKTLPGRFCVRDTLGNSVFLERSIRKNV